MYCIVLPVLHAPSDLSCMCCCVGSQSQQMFKICTADPSLSLAGPHLVSCRAPCVVRLGFWLACGADPVVRGWLGTLCHILCFRLGCWLACGADPWGGGLACYPQPYLAASQAVPCCHCTAIYWQHIYLLAASVYLCTGIHLLPVLSTSAFRSRHMGSASVTFASDSLPYSSFCSLLSRCMLLYTCACSADAGYGACSLVYAHERMGGRTAVVCTY